MTELFQTTQNPAVNDKKIVNAKNVIINRNNNNTKKKKDLE